MAAPLYQKDKCTKMTLHILKLYCHIGLLTVFIVPLQSQQLHCEIYTNDGTCLESLTSHESHELKSAEQGFESKANNELIVEEILRYLELGELEFDKNNFTDITLVVGPTGSGKSTTVQFIANDANKLKALENDFTGEFYIVDENGSVSNQTLISKTFLPELTYHHESSTAFYDCPGFDDTRNASVEIANAFFIKKIADRASRIKVIVVVQDSKLSTGDRPAFPKLLNQLLDLIKSIDKFSGALSMVGTMSPEKKSEAQTINTYYTFLNGSVMEYLSESWGDNPRLNDALYIAESLLLLNNNDGRPTKLGHFRRPNKTGDLDEIPEFQENKRLLKKIILEETHYVETTVGDFGYSLSAEAVLVIYDLVSTLNSLVQQTTLELGAKLGIAFALSIDKIGSTSNLNYTFLQSNVIGLFNSSYPKCQSETNLPFIDYISEIKENIDKFIAILGTDVGDIETFERYTNYLDFIKDAINGFLDIDTDKWTNPLVSLISNVNQCIDNKASEIGDKIEISLSEISSLFTRRFEDMFDRLKEPGYDHDNLGEGVDGLLHANYSKCKSIGGLETAEYKQEIFEDIRRFSVYLGISKEEISRSEEIIGYLETLEDISNRKVSTNFKSWTQPLIDVLTHVKTYVDDNVAIHIYSEVHLELEKLAEKIATRISIKISQSTNLETQFRVINDLQNDLVTVNNDIIKAILDSSLTMETFVNVTLDKFGLFKVTENEDFVEIFSLFPRIHLIEYVGVEDWKRVYWADICDKVGEALVDELQWTSFLNSTYIELSHANEQVRKSNGMHDWRNSNPIVDRNTFEGFWYKISSFPALGHPRFENVSRIAVQDQNKLDTLNILLDLTLTETGCQTSSGNTYVATGYFLILSNIINCVKGNNFNKIIILALNTLYVNDDVSMRDINPSRHVDLFFMAPKLHVDNSRTLNFNGADGERGNSANKRGNAGKSAGNVFGIYKSRQGSFIVQNNGGHGGSGFEGTVGSPGTNGGYQQFNPTASNHAHCSAWKDENIQVKVYPNNCNTNGGKCRGGYYYTILGTEGSAGGTGSDGGAGGEGGNPGINFIVEVDIANATPQIGSVGRKGADGEGGPGGPGGMRGDSTVVRITSRYSWGEVEYYCSLEGKRTEQGTERAASGRKGESGGIKPSLSPEANNFDKSEYRTHIQAYYELIKGMTNQTYFNSQLIEFEQQSKGHTEIPN